MEGQRDNAMDLLQCVLVCSFVFSAQGVHAGSYARLGYQGRPVEHEYASPSNMYVEARNAGLPRNVRRYTTREVHPQHETI
jgi:hypothetical protein